MLLARTNTRLLAKTEDTLLPARIEDNLLLTRKEDTLLPARITAGHDRGCPAFDHEQMLQDRGYPADSLDR
jgi:hypothetical protein